MKTFAGVEINDLELESLQFSLEFNYDQYGLITNPGKFEREYHFVPYFYNMTLHSAQDDIEYIDGTAYDIFNVKQIDYTIFPDLIGIDKVAIFTDSQGFVYGLLDPILD